MRYNTFKMSISLEGDQPFENIPSIKAKALRINLNEHIYGTFAEIGAGQEVARHFFRSGGASGTIAKTMSAYDKEFSDAIYGVEPDNRYVSESRLKKMLSHEINLLESRMDRSKHPNKMFFTYANTVATIDFAKKYRGHGWMGLKFQTDSSDDYSEILIHVRFNLFEARAQQEALGLMGINLITSGVKLLYNISARLCLFLRPYDKFLLKVFIPISACISTNLKKYASGIDRNTHGLS